MTATEYKAIRERIGTQAEVAAMLGVHRITITRREQPDAIISYEAALAINALVTNNALLLDVLETTKLFVQSHPHDRHYMARILKALGMLAPDRYPPAQVAEWVANLTA